MIFDLPTALEVCGETWEIRTDYRDILRCILAFNDPELTSNEKIFVCLNVIYKDFERIPPEMYGEFYKAATEFLDNGATRDNSRSPRTMDWEQDANLIFAAVNKSAGFEVRSAPYIHWWTFLGYFMEIKDTVLSTVLSIRGKKARGKKLEKWEQEFWKENQAICKLGSKLTDEEKEEKERLKKLLG